MGRAPQGPRHRDHGRADAPGVDAGARRAGTGLRRATRAVGRRGGVARSRRAAAGLRPRRGRPHRASRRATPRSSHTSPQTVGLDAGAWCAYGNPADIPVDQRRDDARSLDLRLRAGRGALRDAWAADRDAARQRRPAARRSSPPRLCDVAPDGASTVITRGFLNLCHPDDHEHARDVPVGEPFDVRIAMKAVAYAVPAGHTGAPRAVDELLAVALALARARRAHRPHRRREHAGAAGPHAARARRRAAAARPAGDRAAAGGRDPGPRAGRATR